MRAHDRSSDTVERWLPAQSAAVPQTRAWSREWLTHSRVPADAHEAALLAISELVTNAVRQETDRIGIKLRARDEELLIQVYDSGHRHPSIKEAPPEAIGGRGLHLVEAFCDDWGVREERTGKTVWARLTW